MVDQATRLAATKLRDRANSDITLRFDVRSELRALAESMDPTPKINVTETPGKLVIEYHDRLVPLILKSALSTYRAAYDHEQKLVDQFAEAVQDRANNTMGKDYSLNATK